MRLPYQVKPILRKSKQPFLNIKNILPSQDLSDDYSSFSCDYCDYLDEPDRTDCQNTCED